MFVVAKSACQKNAKIHITWLECCPVLRFIIAEIWRSNEHLSIGPVTSHPEKYELG